MEKGAGNPAQDESLAGLSGAYGGQERYQADPAELVQAEAGEAERKQYASSFVNALVKELCNRAVDGAQGRGIKSIGISGGVSYNIPIVEMAMKNLADAGFELVRHNKVPNGDGGISIGQCGILSALCND